MSVEAYGCCSRVIFRPCLRRCCRLCLLPLRWMNTDDEDQRAMRDRMLAAHEEMDNLVLLLPPRRIDLFLRLEKQLGQGGFGTVFSAVATDWGAQRQSNLEAGCAYAVKRVVMPESGFAEDVGRSLLNLSPERHIEMLKWMTSPRTAEHNIVQGFCIFTEINLRATNTNYQVMEMLTGPDLFDFISSRRNIGVQEHEAARLANHMFTAVHFLHHVAGLLHRDIKSENFGFTLPLLKDAPLPTLKLFDFGLAHVLAKPVTDETALDLLPAKACGTAVYMAPEGFDRRTGPPSDIWGVGNILFFLISMELPFDLMLNVSDPRKALNDNELVFEERRWAGISDAARVFVASLLEKDHSQRPLTSSILTNTWLRVTDVEGTPRPAREPTATDILPHRSKKTGGESSVWQSVKCVTEQHLSKEDCHDGTRASV